MRPEGPDGGRQGPGKLRGPGHPANSSTAWLGPAPRPWHLSLQSFPRISERKLAAREAAGALGNPRAGQVWVGMGPSEPCVPHASAPPLPGSGLGLARSRLPTLSTPCSQASLEDKQDGGQDARGQAPEDAKVEEASTRREQPAGGEDGDECTPEDKVGRAPGLGGHPLAQPCPVHPDCPAPPYRSRSLSPSS